MGAFLIILIVVWLLFIIFRPAITRWTRQFMARRAEDMMRRMMGMPSRKEEQRRQRQASRDAGPRADGRRTRGSGAGGSSRRYHRSPRYDAADLMRSVAEDVEYTEIREFESAVIADDSAGNTRVINEEQVADVEYTEIRGSR